MGLRKQPLFIWAAISALYCLRGAIAVAAPQASSAGR
jgi:hypothetical protein